MPGPHDQTAAKEPEPEPAICGWLTLDIVHDAGDWTELDGVNAAIESVVRVLAAHALFTTHAPSGVCIALSDDSAVGRLNGLYRGTDKPTNVLSFPAGGDAQEPGAETIFLGDVVLALETVLREAEGLGIAPLHHVQHLAIHGVLHLNGYDHETDEDAGVMEALEASILAVLGIASPHSHDMGQEDIDQVDMGPEDIGHQDGALEPAAGV